MSCDFLCQVQTQGCIAIFQQTKRMVRKSQNASLLAVTLGSGYSTLATIDAVELIDLGWKKLVGREIHRQKLDLIYLVANTAIKLAAGVFLLTFGYHTRPYYWNSTVQNKCLDLAIKNQNMTQPECLAFCPTVLQIPESKIVVIPAICGALNMGMSVIATAVDTVLLYKRYRTRNDVELQLLSDPYRKKKFKERVFTNATHLVINILFFVLFFSNAFNVISNLFGESRSYPSIANRCSQFCL